MRFKLKLTLINALHAVRDSLIKGLWRNTFLMNILKAWHLKAVMKPLLI